MFKNVLKNSRMFKNVHICPEMDISVQGWSRMFENVQGFPKTYTIDPGKNVYIWQKMTGQRFEPEQKKIEHVTH